MNNKARLQDRHFALQNRTTAHNGELTSFLHYDTLKCAVSGTANSYHMLFLVGLVRTNVILTPRSIFAFLELGISGNITTYVKAQKVYGMP